MRPELKACLPAACRNESKDEAGASLFENAPLSRTEALELGVLRGDEALLLDEIMERLESELSSLEIFTALFELERSGRIKQLPGTNYVKSL